MPPWVLKYIAGKFSCSYENLVLTRVNTNILCYNLFSIIDSRVITKISCLLVRTLRSFVYSRVGHERRAVLPEAVRYFSFFDWQVMARHVGVQCVSRYSLLGVAKSEFPTPVRFTLQDRLSLKITRLLRSSTNPKASIKLRYSVLRAFPRDPHYQTKLRWN